MNGVKVLIPYHFLDIKKSKHDKKRIDIVTWDLLWHKEEKYKERINSSNLILKINYVIYNLRDLEL